MKRVFATIIMLALICACIAPAALAEDETADGTADTSWYSENEDAFTLNTAAELAGLAELVNGGNTFLGKTVTLGCNIDLSAFGTWTPIGKAENVPLNIESQEDLSAAANELKVVYDDVGNSYSGSEKDVAYAEGRSYYYARPGVFSGTFDGGGYAISGLQVSTKVSYAGLFGNVNGTVRNFTLSGKVSFTGSNGDYIGGAAGMLSAGGTVSRVTSDVTVSAGSAWNVGGIVGFVGARLSSGSAGNTTVEMCVNNGAVTGYNKVGGIAGENAGTVSQCVNTAVITIRRISTKGGVGGIVGRNGNNATASEAGTVINCYNTGTTSSTKWSGGITGFNNALSKVENCYTTVAPGGTLSYSNPIVGYDESYRCSNNYALDYDGLTYTGTEECEVGILLESDELQKAAYALGGAYRSDPGGGYPELLWRLNSGTVTFDVAPAAESTIQVADSLGVQVVPEPDGSYLLVNGETYTYTVAAAGYKTAAGSFTAADGVVVGVTLTETVGPVVTVNNATGTTTPATLSGVISGEDYVSGPLTYHVDCPLACAVAYSIDGGETYTRLSAAACEGGGYDFTIGLTADTEIAVVLKGDLNLTGTVNSVDVVLARRAMVGQNALTPLQELAADVNASGSLSSADVVLLRRSMVGSTVFGW